MSRRVSTCRCATCARACTPASVRPAPYSSNSAPGRLVDGTFEVALHRPGVLLDLPPAVAGARVLDGELETRHRWFRYATGTRLPCAGVRGPGILREYVAVHPMTAARRVAAAIVLMLVAAAGIVDNSWFDRDRRRAWAAVRIPLPRPSATGRRWAAAMGPAPWRRPRWRTCAGMTLADADGEVLTEALAQTATAPVATGAGGAVQTFTELFGGAGRHRRRARPRQPHRRAHRLQRRLRAAGGDPAAHRRAAGAARGSARPRVERRRGRGPAPDRLRPRRGVADRHVGGLRPGRLRGAGRSAGSGSAAPTCASSRRCRSAAACRRAPPSR